MKKKQTKHFVPKKDERGAGIPACHGFGKFGDGDFLWAFKTPFEEVAGSRKTTTCGNCQRTRVFRRLK